MRTIVKGVMAGHKNILTTLKKCKLHYTNKDFFSYRKLLKGTLSLPFLVKGKEPNLPMQQLFFNPKGAGAIIIFYKWVEGILINNTVCPSVLNIVIVPAVNSL